MPNNRTSKFETNRMNELYSKQTGSQTTAFINEFTFFLMDEAIVSFKQMSDKCGKFDTEKATFQY